MDNNEFANILRTLRCMCKITQEALSEKLFISCRWYQEIESGRRVAGKELKNEIISFFKNFDFENEQVQSVGYLPVYEKLYSESLANMSRTVYELLTAI